MSVASCPVNYPTVSEATPCLIEVVSLIRDGKLYDDLDHAAKHLWVIQGAAQGAILGDPDVPPLVGSTDFSTDAGAAAILESAVPQPGVVNAVPWLLVLQVAASLLQKLLAKKLES